MEIWNAIVNFIVASVLMGTTLMYGTLGEILTEKSGNLNLGVEGLIYMGGAGGLIAPYLYEQAAGEAASPVIGLILAILAGFLVAAFGSLIFSFLTITLRANQNVTGLALTIFGVGFGKFFGEYYRVKAGGRLVISSDLDHLFTCIGGGICGLGGLYFTMVSGSGNWAADAMDGKGWLAVALVIFALWRPLRAVWGSILFGALMIMYMRVTVFPIPTEIYKILPYVVTLIVLIVLSIRQRRENQPPASLGNAYFREER